MPDVDPLIAGQYADRPALRPILDAVLAVLPSVGDVTVEPRRTCVSLVSPRRVFAVVQATTKKRVDLGLRLDGVEPTGRLVPAKHIGSGTIAARIPLAAPDDVDDEVLDWLVRAYRMSTVPPVRATPRRRTVTTVGTLTVAVEGRDLPGLSCSPPHDGEHHAVHVALWTTGCDRPTIPVTGAAWLVTEPVPGDAPVASWECEVEVRRDEDGLDFAGPFVRGVRDDRHLGLIWGDLADGVFRTFRGAKLRLVDVDPDTVAAAMGPGQRLVGRLGLSDRHGDPVCARVNAPKLAWSVEPDEGLSAAGR